MNTVHQVTLAPGNRRGPTVITHPNDQDLTLEVKHAPGATVRLETDDNAYAGTHVSTGHSRVTIPTHALTYRVGRMDVQLQADHITADITLDLLAPPEQAKRVRELVTSLVKTPLALLAMPRGKRQLEPESEGEPDRVENLLEATRLYSEASQLLAANPPTRVNEVEAETPPGARLTAAIVHAITHQPYGLQLATPGPNTLPIRGRHYTTASVHAPVLSEDTDTPANRYVHGVGRALERLANDIHNDLKQEHRTLADDTQPISGYVTIRQLTRTQAAEATKERLETVAASLHDVRLARARLEKRLPVRAPSLALTAAPKVLLDPRYARVRRALDLLRAPTRHQYGSEGLIAGITSLTTLYELYCLATLHDQLLDLGYQLESHEHDPSSGTPHQPHRLQDGTPFPNTFTYQHAERGELSLHYEPRITRDPHPTLGLACVSSQTSVLTPDIVLATREHVIVFDAKFTANPPRDLIADAALKYLHGLHNPNKPIAGLYLLHYGPTAKPVDFHDRPITPGIATFPAHPNNRQALEGLVARLTQAA